MKGLKRLVPLALAAALLAGCAQGVGAGVSSSGAPKDEVYVDRVVLEQILIEDEPVPLSSAPIALSGILLPEASGKQVKESSRAIIDYSNVKDGYVMVKFTASTDKRLKALVQGPSYASKKLQYSYDLKAGEWVTLPLSDGNGDYTVLVCENSSGTKYAQAVSQKFKVTLADEFAPFIRPNQYVDYASATKTVEKAKELVGKETDTLKRVGIIYNFVVKNLTYDKNLAATVQSGYLPVLDDVLAAKKGICFDYAALMAGMLRSLGIPCKLITGYVPVGNGQTGYHAWISVWSEETGWVEGAIYFDGTAWQRMDPTFASSSKGSDTIMKYIGDGTNYSEKYIY